MDPQKLAEALIEIDNLGVPFEISTINEYEDEACEQCDDYTELKGKGYTVSSRLGCTNWISVDGNTLLEALQEYLRVYRNPS